MSKFDASIGAALNGMPLRGYIQGTATTSLDQGIAATVARAKAIINDIIKNFDFNTLLETAKRSLDWHTYIDLAPSPRAHDSRTSTEPQGRRQKAAGYIETGVNILFEINEQYPSELKMLVIVLFILAPLGMAIVLLIIQGWDTQW
eukprot:jgi/Ulvmu1/7615/UM038_0040.1